jgi:electron transfer flavoprotein beta subunit
VGPGVAEMLDIPFVAWVRKVEEITSGTIRVERLMEDGYDIVEAALPALITVVKEINEPRMASLKGKMKAKKAEIKVLSAADLEADPAKIGTKGSPTQVFRSFVPERKAGGEKLTGEVPDMVAKLKTTILDLGVIK